MAQKIKHNFLLCLSIKDSKDNDYGKVEFVFHVMMYTLNLHKEKLMACSLYEWITLGTKFQCFVHHFKRIKVFMNWQN